MGAAGPSASDDEGTVWGTEAAKAGGAEGLGGGEGCVPPLLRARARAKAGSKPGHRTAKSDRAILSTSSRRTEPAWSVGVWAECGSCQGGGGG